RPCFGGRRLFRSRPTLFVRRDDLGDHIAIGVIFTTAIIPRPALLDPDAGDKTQAIEIAKLNGASLARLLAHIVGLNPAGALNNSAQLSTGNFTASSCPAVVPTRT